jgi:hypothetical protein
VTYTAQDTAGNTSTCSFTVTVVDDTPPTVTAGTIESCYQTVGAAQTDAINATTASDNCGGTLTKTASTVGNCSATITVTVTDVAGNSASVNYSTRIDGVAPVISAMAATQAAANVENCAATVLQGTVNISVQASDNCGLVGPPTIGLANGLATATAMFVNQSPAGTYNYTWMVGPTTANGTWTATVTAANGCQSSTATFTLCVNAAQITGDVELEGFVGTGTVPLHTRTIVFVATDTAPPGAGTILKTWTLPLTFTGDTASYTLTGVPAGTLGLSAKTDWNLRKKLPIALVGNQATAEFTGANLLKGGDIAGAPIPTGPPDNVVNLADYQALVLGWLLPDPVADINGDGEVNIFDYAILANNWYTAGDPQ